MQGRLADAGQPLSQFSLLGKHFRAVPCYAEAQAAKQRGSFCAHNNFIAHDCPLKQGCIQRNKQTQTASIESGACSASTCNLSFFIPFSFQSSLSRQVLFGIGGVGGWRHRRRRRHRLRRRRSLPDDLLFTAGIGLVWSGLVWWAVSLKTGELCRGCYVSACV